MSRFLGFYTALKREIARYMKSPWGTIVPPLISIALYIFIFGVAIGPRIGTVNGFPYIQFMLAGIIMMSVILNSYSNPAFSLFQARFFGNLAEFLVSPMSYLQILLAYILAGVLRGIITGLLVLIPSVLFAGLPILNFWWMAFYLLVVSFTFSCLGVITGLWAKNWDSANNLLTFIITPLTYFGGVFYSLEMIRGIPIIEQLTILNPITYMVNGLRFGIIGITDVNLFVGIGITLGLGIGLFVFSWHLFRVGWKLKN